MAKNKKNNKKGKAGKKKMRMPVKPKVLANNASPRPVRVARPVKMNHTSAVCSVTDPFCPAAKNSKWPDGTSGNTLTEQLRGFVTLTTSAQGEAAATFMPGCPYGYMVATVVTGTATYPAAYTAWSASTLFTTYGASWRIVSFGVIVRCVASATQAAGLVTLGTLVAVAPNAVYTNGQELYDQVVVKSIQPGMEVSWISQPRGPDARSFIPATTAAAINNAPFTALVVEISGGGNAVASVNCEWFMNIEFTALGTKRDLTKLARPNPPASDAAHTAVSSIHNSLGSFIEGGVAHAEQAVADAASKALTAFTADPLSSLAALFGGL